MLSFAWLKEEADFKPFLFMATALVAPDTQHKIKCKEIYNMRQVQYLRRASLHQFNRSVSANEMEGLSEKVNRYHPLDKN